MKTTYKLFGTSLDGIPEIIPRDASNPNLYLNYDEELTLFDFAGFERVALLSELFTLLDTDKLERIFKNYPQKFLNVKNDYSTENEVIKGFICHRLRQLTFLFNNEFDIELKLVR